jgi:toxin CcdB
MGRFDVFANPTASERSHTPFVLDVQNDHLKAIGSRVVIPLRTPKYMGTLARELNPSLEINGKTVVLDTASLAPVPEALLQRPVASVKHQPASVIDALDTLFGSY